MHFRGVIKEVALPDQDYVEFRVKADTTQPLRVTICWTDPPGQEHPYELDPTNIVLVNDLDLRMISPDGSVTNKPWILDPSNPSAPATTGDNIRDNVEQVHIQNPSNGWYTVRVTHKGSLTNGVQDVSVIVTGNISTNMPEFRITDIWADTGGPKRFQWGSVVGSLYRIETVTNLLEKSAWTDELSDDINCTKENTLWIDDIFDPLTEDRRFYRVKAVD